MKLRACTIIGFGKFYRKSYSFSDGIQVIYGANEAGKTTLRTFLISMLFGIERKRGSGSKKDEFHKYQPYNGGIYGGSLDIELAGTPYQVQRNFTDVKDICVYDGVTGKKTLQGQELSGRMFQTTKEGYFQTLCIQQGDIQTGRSLRQMLNHYLTNMSHSKTQEVNVENAIRYLKKEIRGCKQAPEYEEYKLLRLQQREQPDPGDLQKGLQQIENEEEQLALRMERMQQEISGHRSIWKRITDWIRKLLGYENPAIYQLEKAEYERKLLAMRKAEFENSLEEYKKLRKQLKNIKEKITATEYNRKAMETAIRAIAEASEEIHREFGDEFQQKVCEIIAYITNGTYEKVRIDDAMGIVVEKDGSFLDIDYLSTGTIEQIYFAVRLAAAELLFPTEKFPIILDDVFGNFDQTRMRQTLQYLVRLNRQIFIFSCKQEVIQVLEEIKCSYQLIEMA